MTKETAVATTGKRSMAVANITGYAACEIDPDDFRAAIVENLGDENFSVFKLDRVKVPSGGSTTFCLPSIDGEYDSKTLEGVIVYKVTTRSLFVGQYTGEKAPPVCRSLDGITGMGSPGGNCKTCPQNQFDEAAKTPKACKESTLLFVLMPDTLLPTLIAVPPGSLGDMSKYFLRLVSHGCPYWRVVTSLSLRKAKNSSGIEYSQIVPISTGKIVEPELTAIKNYRESMLPALKAALESGELHEENQDYGESPADPYADPYARGPEPPVSAEEPLQDRSGEEPELPF